MMIDFCTIFPRWDELKPKDRDKLRSFYYNTDLQKIIGNMFEYTFETEHMDDWLIEPIMDNSGMIGYCVIDGVLCYGDLSITGDIGKDGIAKHGKIIFANGESFEGTIGEDIVVVYNNHLHTRDYDLDWYGYMFNEVDKSLDCCIQNSRPNIITLVKNSKVLKAISEAIKQRRTGQPISIMDSSTLESIRAGSSTTNAVNLGDPNIVDKVQNLSKFYDDLLRRFCSKYGISMQSTGKMAQINEEELQGYESFSMIVPYDKYMERIKGMKQIKEILGVDCSVRFSAPWRVSFETNQGSENGDDPTEEKEPSEEGGVNNEN